MEKVSKHSIQCDCYNPAHAIQIVHWSGHARKDGNEESMIIFTQMSHAGGFWRRLKIALRYIFNLPQGEEYPWADTYMSSKDIDDLRNYLNGLYKRDEYQWYGLSSEF